MEQLLSIEEASKKTGLSVAGIYKMTCTRRIPFVKLGSRVFFDPERLKKWIEEHSIEPVSSGSSR